MVELEATDVLVPTERYLELIKNENKLRALEDAGVDNWEGYDDVMETLGDEDD